MNAPLHPVAALGRRKALPRPFRRVARKLPHVPSSAVVAAMLNLLLRRRLPREALERLGERIFFIEAQDAGLLMAFRCRDGRFYPAPPFEVPALRIRVNAADFVTFVDEREAPAGFRIDASGVAGDPVLATAVREALARLDVARTRKLVARVVRHVERVNRQD